jgi:hypothetical protein
VLVAAEAMPDHLMLHGYCEMCGQVWQWRCTGAPGMPEFRFNHFANEHTHGLVPQVYNPMPRQHGIRSRRPF